MQIIHKVPHGNGHVHVYFMGIKLYSFKPKQFIFGQNNILDISKSVDLNLKMVGNNNKIIIRQTNLSPHLNIQVLCNNSEIHIGENASIGNLSMIVHDNNTKIVIGSDCMFSTNVTFWPSDGHAILNDKGTITNRAKSITIGNLVWLGAGVTICKNTEIADGCIVGTNAVVSGKFKKANCVLAGNPARVVKENVIWDRKKPDEYIQVKK